MNRWVLAIASAIVLTSAGPTSAATTYYVATTGNDTANCGTSSSPCKTVQVAIDKTVDGDTVRVRSGVYNECIFVSPLSVGAITLETDAFATNGTVGAATLDGANQCDVASGFPGPVAIVFDQSVMRGFAVKNGGDSGVWGFGSVAITNNTITGNRTSTFAGGVFIYTGAYVTEADTKVEIRANTISSNTASGSGAGLYMLAFGNGIPTVAEVSENTLRTNTAGPDPDINSFGVLGGAMTILSGTATSTDAASVVITRNTIDGNTAVNADNGYPSYGGGLFVATGIFGSYGTESVKVGEVGEGNVVRNNSAEGYGGGISVNLQPGLGANHSIQVAGNSVTANTGGRGGGGIHAFFITGDPDNGGTGTLEVKDNAVSGNHASDPPASGVLGGGGIFAEIYSRRTPAGQIRFEIERNTFELNDSGSIGGGASLFAYADDDPELNGVIFPADAEIDFRNNLVARNKAIDTATDAGRGGGVWAAGRAFGDQARAAIDQEFLTVVANETDAGAAGGLEWEASPELDSAGTLGSVSVKLSNSIIAFNQFFAAGGPIAPGGPVSVDISYNDAFQNGGTSPNWEANLGTVDGVNGNVSIDPGLDALNVPQLCSATIDLGDPAVSASAEPQPNGGRVNMGHLGGTSNATRTLPDVNGDGIVDGIDILRLAIAFNAPAGDPRYDAAVDVDLSDLVDGDDLSYLAALYAQSCP